MPDSSPAPAGDAAATAQLREGPGTRIGPYTLIEQIGEGGFGVVFVAEQTQPVQRRVALKIIKLGMDTHQVVARFEQERQALALMDHPNIARVIDAGATETGRPYFVMDLVIGAPIAEYCDANNLAIDERLALFEQVCNAVQHAHGKGIIHRDIKPSNILVASQDGKPLAKVIDFGIAKATSAKLTARTLQTEHLQVIGTLQYMSPEQAEGSLDIDTRTDVYALGVVLYELLTGTPPLELKTLQAAMYDEIQRLIREVDPPKPSTRLSKSTDTLPSVAAHRSVDPKRLSAIVRGELDWIVMKALEKDRARRYESASGLALDVRRYLAGEAVLAAPPSATYRLRKFVRRNKGVVAAAGAVTASLLIGVVGFAWQARIAERLAKSESKQRAIAESNERKAAAINQFLLDMLGSADLTNLGRDAKVAAVLDQAAASVGTAFPDRPEVEAAVRQILAKTYLSLGLFDQCEPQIDAALTLNRGLYGEASKEVAQCLICVGTLNAQRGRGEVAVDALRRAVEIFASVLGPEDLITLGSRCEYANALTTVKRDAEAETILRDALAALRRIVGHDTRDTLVFLNSLAVLLHNQKRLDEAEALYRECVELADLLLGPENVDALIAHMNLGSMLNSRGKLAEAEPIMKEAYADLKRVCGDSHRKVATAAQALAELYLAQGRYKDALPLREECVAIVCKVEGDRSVGAARVKEHLALALERMHQSKRAAEVEREALDVYVALDGPENPRTISARLDLANMLAGAEQVAEAERLFRELLEQSPRVLGADDPRTIIATNSYGVLLIEQDRFAEAEPYVRAALEAGRRVEGADAENTIVTQYNLATTTRELGRLAESEEIGRDCLERFTRVFGPTHPNTGSAHADYGETLRQLQRTDDAERELTESIAIHKAAYGADHPAFVWGATALGKLRIDVGRAEAALPVLEDAVQIDTRARGLQHAHTAVVRVQLGRCYARLARFTDAEATLTESYDILLKSTEPHEADIRDAERALAEFYGAWNAAEPNADRAAKAAEWKAKVDAQPRK